jgi:hypothetical protein
MGSVFSWLAWRFAIARWQRSRRAAQWACSVYGDRNGRLARGAWNLAERLHHGRVGFAALVANAASFGLLWAYRGCDANMRSAWICTRNDVLSNLAVLLAAAGVFGTGTGWPDVVVAAIMAGLGLQGAWIVTQQSLGELRHPLALSA